MSRGAHALGQAPGYGTPLEGRVGGVGPQGEFEGRKNPSIPGTPGIHHGGAEETPSRKGGGRGGCLGERSRSVVGILGTVVAPVMRDDIVDVTHHRRGRGSGHLLAARQPASQHKPPPHL